MDDLLVVQKGNNVFCDSRMVAEKFELKHNRVLRTIERNRKKYEGTQRVPSENQVFNPIFTKVRENYHGQEFDAYLLNRDAFMVISMRFETPHAVEWQRKFFTAFKQMERLVLEKIDPTYLEARKIGKLVRVQSTGTMQRFIEYAKTQGSLSPEKYYVVISVMINKLLFIVTQKYKNLRELLTTKQLSITMCADSIIEKALNDGMCAGMFYKDIYQLAKGNLMLFVRVHGQSTVPDSFQYLEGNRK